MDAKEKKDQRIAEVNHLLAEFAQEHLTPELEDYTFNLWGRVGRKRDFAITTGKKEAWAAGVVYLIARLNFLFDQKDPDYLPVEVICGHFGVSKSNAATRARQIEKACKIRLGEEGLCSPHITDVLTMIELPSGMIMNVDMAKRMGILPGPIFEPKRERADTARPQRAKPSPKRREIEPLAEPPTALADILEEALENRANAVTLEIQPDGLEVTLYWGDTGVGSLVKDRKVASEIIEFIVDTAEVEWKSRGKMELALHSRECTVLVERYEYFGEVAFRLTFAEPK